MQLQVRFPSLMAMQINILEIPRFRYIVWKKKKKRIKYWNVLLNNIKYCQCHISTSHVSFRYKRCWNILDDLEYIGRKVLKI